MQTKIDVVAFDKNVAKEVYLLTKDNNEYSIEKKWKKIKMNKKIIDSLDFIFKKDNDND